MIDLKTLKDITGRVKDTTIDVALIGDLKQEAIKWIKDRRNRIDEIYEGCFLEPHNFNGDWVYQNEAIVRWIKRFFNIKEEDLQ